MKTAVFKPFSLFDAQGRITIYLLFALILMGTGIELFGIGAILPLSNAIQ